MAIPLTFLKYTHFFYVRAYTAVLHTFHCICSHSQIHSFLLQTKLANPHYKPEMQAQATLINFTVTKDGLEEQLLAEVVATERPDLEKTKVCITIIFLL